MGGRGSAWTNKARDKMDVWSAEVKRLQSERNELLSKQAKQSARVKAKGFQYTDNRGRITTVQRTSTGAVLVNGAPNNSVNYNALKRAAKSRQGFKTLTASESRNISAARSERQAKKPDYELLYNTRGKGKSVYRPKK